VSICWIQRSVSGAIPLQVDIRVRVGSTVRIFSCRRKVVQEWKSPHDTRWRVRPEQLSLRLSAAIGLMSSQTASGTSRPSSQRNMVDTTSVVSVDIMLRIYHRVPQRVVSIERLVSPSPCLGSRGDGTALAFSLLNASRSPTFTRAQLHVNVAISTRRRRTRQCIPMYDR
jgi:hypothetical protein